MEEEAEEAVPQTWVVEEVGEVDLPLLNLKNAYDVFLKQLARITNILG